MAQLTAIRGFINTPVTKKVIIGTTILALAISIFQIKYLFVLSIDPFILEFNQFWRILSFQLSVINESDYLLTIFLWFHFKNLERFYGSKKYLSLILVFFVYNAILTFFIMSLGQLLVNFIDYSILTILKINGYTYFTTILNSIIPGPLGVLSSLYICFGTYIPVSYQFKILLTNKFGNTESNHEHEHEHGIEIDLTDDLTEQQHQQDDKNHGKSKELILTDHFQIHIIYTLLLLNNGFQSIIPCLIGIFIGKLYINDLLPGSKSWLLPNTLFRIFINPYKVVTNIIGLARRRFNGYQSISEIVDDDEPIEAENNEEQEGEENRGSEIRAETPVRPLASQFLDTFRSRTD